MTIQQVKVGRLFGAAMLVLLFVIPSANAWGSEGCLAYQATLQGSFLKKTPTTPAGWFVDSYFTIGDVVLHAKIVYAASDIVPEKNTQNVFQGAEKGVVTVDGVGTFDLVSQFTAPLQKVKEGVAILNESGTIGNGTGVFANISGHFTNHGVYGTAVVHSAGTMGFVANMNGNICGIDLITAGLASATK